jgi:hypothetical protein
MTNLNDTPSLGPLTAADLQRYRAMHRPYIPRGCDAQGRYPEAAHACTDIGADDDLACAVGIVRAAIWMLALYAAGACAWLLLH